MTKDLLGLDIEIPKGSKYRSGDDHFPTPREASIPFVRTAWLTKQVWEPMCGTGDLSKVLVEHGHDVVSTTLADRGYGQTGVNFFECKELLAPTICSNPAFITIDEFVIHALSLKPDVLAVFAKTKFLEGRDRYRDIHAKTPYSIQYQFIERVVFYAGDIPKEDQPGWNTEAFSWFVWIAGWNREPVTRWLHIDDGLQPKML